MLPCRVILALLEPDPLALVKRAPAPPRVSEEEALRVSGSDAVYYAMTLKGASKEKTRRELEFRPRALEWIQRSD
jgi:hypothetical protein